MTQHEAVEFKFTCDWIHAGVSYHDGDVVRFAPGTAHMLAQLGAGENTKTARRRREVDPDNTPHDETGE